MGKTKFYAVKNGRNGPQIYNTWELCLKDVTGFSGAIFKSFGNLRDAQVYCGLSPSTGLDCDNNISKDNNDSQKYQHLKIRVISLEAIDEILGEIDLKKLTQYPYIRGKNIKLYTDGSCTNIGTPQAIAGSGIYYPDFNLGLSVKVPGDQTNNRGELWATIYGICFLNRLLQKIDSIHCRTTEQSIFQIHTDSTYTLNNLRNKAVANLDLCLLLKELNNSHKLEFCKVLAHSGDLNNEIADELARHFVFVEP